MAFGIAVAAAGCSDSPTGSSARPGSPRGATQLTGVTATACEYGGEYPNCEPKPVDPTAGGVAPTPSADPQAPSGGGGGTTSTPDSTTAACDPTVDPKCEQELTTTDSVTIQNGLAQFVRAPGEVADTTARRQCGEMVAKFRERLGARKVFRGAYDSQGGDAHYAGTFDGHIHFDPQTLADAEKGVPGGLRELINTALHEAAHTLGILHPSEFDATGHYSDPYFNLLDPGSNTCLK